MPKTVAGGRQGTNICTRIEPLSWRRFAQSYGARGGASCGCRGLL